MSNFEAFGARSNSRSHDSEVISSMDTPEIIKTRESAKELLQCLDSVDEFVLAKNQNSLLTDLPTDRLIVRREDPDKLVDLIRNREPIALSFVGGTPYANSVEWNPSIDGTRGLDNAYLEGFSHKDNVVAVYGFEKPADFYFEQLNDSERVFNGVDRSRVRAAAGFVPLEAIQFVTIRIPIKAMNHTDLTEDELDALYDYNNEAPEKRKPVFVYRTYLRASDAVTK